MDGIPAGVGGAAHGEGRTEANPGVDTREKDDQRLGGENGEELAVSLFDQELILGVDAGKEIGGTWSGSTMRA